MIAIMQIKNLVYSLKMFKQLLPGNCYGLAFSTYMLLNLFNIFNILLSWKYLSIDYGTDLTLYILPR